MKAVPSGLTDGTGRSGDNAGAAETDSCEYRILWDRNWETLDAASDLTPAETAGGARYAADLQVQEGRTVSGNSAYPSAIPVVQRRSRCLNWIPTGMSGRRDDVQEDDRWQIMRSGEMLVSAALR